MEVLGESSEPDPLRRQRLLDVVAKLERQEDSRTADDPSPSCPEDESFADEARRLAERLERVTQTLNAPLRCDAPQFVAVGSTLRIVEPLARGGQGSVYLAFDETLKREVAVKTSHWSDPDSAARLRKEAEIAARLNHPGIVPVFGAGQTELGLPFLVMRFVPGVTLERYLADARNSAASEGTDARIRKALEAFAAVCRTVAYAHDRGILHLDLKPSNILLGALGETALLDWGLSSPFRRDARPASSIDVSKGSDLRRHAAYCGTPEFFSPERLDGSDGLNRWTDVYSLGAVLDRIVRGSRNRRHEGRSTAATADSRAESHGSLPLAANAKRTLRELADWACATKPEARPSSASDLADAVDQLLKKSVSLSRSRRVPLFARIFRRNAE